LIIDNFYLFSAAPDLTSGAVFVIIRPCEKYEKYERSDPMPGGKHILGKKKQQRVFGTAKVGDRGQIVIPKEAREFFGIEPGDTLLILGKNETGLIVTKPETLNDLASQIFQTVEKED
jgi:AbrB family looped-hinge helix DNA binding protein